MNEAPHSPLSLAEKLIAFLGLEPKNRDQIIHILRQAQANNIVDNDSLRMIEGVLQVSEMHVSEIMIPRAEMIVIQKELAFETMLPIVIQSGHSRFPVIGDNKDEVIGILLAKDLLEYHQEETPSRFSLKELLRPAIYVPENKRLNVLLHEFRKNRHHLAIVVDEYGGVSGLITIEDVLEQIVGDIEDEHDIDKGIFIKKHKKNQYSVKGLTPIEEFNAFFHTQLSATEFDTIGGLVSKHFGHLPKRGEILMLEGLKFTVLRANTRRIQILQVSHLPPAPQAQQTNVQKEH